MACICCAFDRKIEIVQFASRTRQLFVRLLALVKWMNSASKVNKCGVSANQDDVDGSSSSIMLTVIYQTLQIS